MDILKSSQLVIFSPSTKKKKKKKYFYNIFLQKPCRFSLQTLTKFEAAKTGSGVGFLRLTAVCLVTGYFRGRFLIGRAASGQS